MAKKKKKKESVLGKALRTWSPGKYAKKLIKGEPIGVSEKRAAEFTKKTAKAKEERKAKSAKKTKKHKESVAKLDKGTGAKSWYPGKYVKKLIKGEPIGVPKSKKKVAAKPDTKAEGKRGLKKIAAKPVEQKFGKAFSSARKAGKKTFTWKGKSYTTKTADDVKKEKAAKPSGKTFGKAGLKKRAQKASKSRVSTPDAKEQIAEMNRQTPAPEKKKKVYQEGGMVQPPVPPAPPEASPSIQPPQASYDKGGKVESNPFGWPSRDARSGFGKKK